MENINFFMYISKQFGKCGLFRNRNGLFNEDVVEVVEKDFLPNGEVIKKVDIFEGIRDRFNPRVIEYDQFIKNDGQIIEEIPVNNFPKRPCNLNYPADSLSLSLAYRQAEHLRAAIPEEILQYGFRQTPEIERKFWVNIPEERLQSVDREVVELKPICGPELFAEDVIKDKTECLTCLPKTLRYDQIGYLPEIEKPCARKFVRKLSRFGPRRFGCGRFGERRHLRNQIIRDEIDGGLVRDRVDFV